MFFKLVLSACLWWFIQSTERDIVIVTDDNVEYFVALGALISQYSHRIAAIAIQHVFGYRMFDDLENFLNEDDRLKVLIIKLDDMDEENVTEKLDNLPKPKKGMKLIHMPLHLRKPVQFNERKYSLIMSLIDESESKRSDYSQFVSKFSNVEDLYLCYFLEQEWVQDFQDISDILQSHEISKLISKFKELSLSNLSIQNELVKRDFSGISIDKRDTFEDYVPKAKDAIVALYMVMVFIQKLNYEEHSPASKIDRYVNILPKEWTPGSATITQPVTEYAKKHRYEILHFQHTKEGKLEVQHYIENLKAAKSTWLLMFFEVLKRKVLETQRTSPPKTESSHPIESFLENHTE